MGTTVDKTMVLRAIDADSFFKGALAGYRQTGPAKATALCPFHDERHPSFHLHLERKVFHCFGCGAGGDMFTFVMRRDGIRFPEAVELLARFAGIPSTASSSEVRAAIESVRRAARRREQERRYAAEIRAALDASIDMAREAQGLIAAAREMDVTTLSEQRLDDALAVVAEAYEIVERDTYGHLV